MNCSDPSEPELLDPKDGALVVAMEFVKRQLPDIAEHIPDRIQTKWAAELAELFTNFAGKD